MNTETVKVRMAPSPTGFFHVGSARTALYNWLFARHHGGKFVLRIEDTDIERSSREMIQVILDGLQWLKLDWDEEPIYQSNRLEQYQRHITILLDKKLAYYCYCQPEDLEKEKQEAYAQKKDWQYDRRCLHLSDAEKQQKEQAGIPKAVRFMVPDSPIQYKDIVFGDITKQAQDIEDFVIMRSNGMPTYNLACVVDDHDMKITHVIRGADHIANTPKQILLYRAFGFKEPHFAHLPLILGPDKSKLSKRHGAVSVMDYKDKGYIPEAFTNYLALLGWSPGDDTEVMSSQELMERFTLERINASNAVFDATKLEWMNQQHIMQMDSKTFQNSVTPFVQKYGLLSKETILENNARFVTFCNLMQSRLKTLDEISDQGKYFFKDDFSYDKTALNKFTTPETLSIVREFLPVIENIAPFSIENIENELRKYSDAKGFKVKQWIHPLRVYTTGTTAGPPFFDTLELIGKERVIQRIKNILKEYGGSCGKK